MIGGIATALIIVAAIESIKDTLLDLANYALMTILEVEEQEESKRTSCAIQSTIKH